MKFLLDLIPVHGIYREVYLTFDVEDFINPISPRVLLKILKTLKKYDLKGLFFITGHMAEKIAGNATIIRLLEDHNVGYHSSAHSVRPTIPEFTDLQSYNDAMKVALVRETSHINPLTGKPEGEGGISTLREAFGNKNVVAFRAPGHCWTPPHLDALQRLGIRFDFSAKLFQNGVPYNGIVALNGVYFLPFPTNMENSLPYLSYLLCRRRKLVLEGHEWSFVNSRSWDEIFRRRNPPLLIRTPLRTEREIASKFGEINYLAKYLRVLRKLRILKIMQLNEHRYGKKLYFRESEILQTYDVAMRWARTFLRYKPKHILSHFHRFFEKGQAYSTLDAHA